MKQFYKHLAILLLICTSSLAQVGIGTTTPEGALDITSTNSGVLVPRVSLTSKSDAATVSNPQGGGLIAGTLVWNTATAGVSPNNVVPGFYYWTGSAWAAMGGDTTRQWSLSGNSGTTPGTDYLGTTDNVDLRIKTNGADRFNFSSNGRLRSYDNGITAQPTYSWIGDEDTGLWRPSADVIAFSTGGVERLRIPAAAQVHAMSLGSAALPFYSFTADPNTGLFSFGADQLSLSTGGIERLRIPAANQVHAMSLGTVALPFYSFSADPDTGMYSTAANNLAFSTAGVLRMRLLANGQVAINTATPVAGDQFSVNSTAYAVNGYTTGANGSGVYGSATNATSSGVFGYNSNAAGTGIVGSGQTGLGSFLTAGSGGAFSGWTTGLYSFYETAGTGRAILAQDDWGGEWQVGAYNNTTGVTYKIIGDGTVSTIVKDLNNERVVMHCAESPEILFEDYGIGKLVNGRAHITIDPIFARNIVVNEQHPLKVFVQLEGECNGVYVTNKSAASFDVIELQSGTSNTGFSYSIVATRADETQISSSGETRVVKYGTRFEKAPELQKRTQKPVKELTRE
ncbi:MAG TPA: hypothetical protein VF676_06080 [Flavobacterium sp.]|jgi:hypothetical protein